MHTLVIHLPSATERRRNVGTILKVLPDAHEIEAVDGRVPGAEGRIEILSGTLHDPTYPFELLPGEVGCFLSHRKCWQRIVDEGWDYALIVEDDMGLNLKAYDDLQDLLKRNATPDSYIRLPPKNREVQHHVDDTQGALSLITPRVVGLQTTAQLVGRKAAERLLKVTEKIDRPVDTFLQMHWITGLHMQAIQPMAVIELHFSGNSSTVQQKTSKGLGAKLTREWNRASYRSRVKARPQRTGSRT